MNKRKTASIYVERLERIVSQIPLDKVIEDSVVQHYHELIDDLSKDLSVDYSKYKVPESNHNVGTHESQSWNYWESVPVRTRMFDLAGTLKVEYETDKSPLSEIMKSKTLDLINKLSWQVILTILTVIGAILTSYFISKLKIR